MGKKIFILGAPDPEMASIEAMLTHHGQRFVHAMAGGKRVHPGNAYMASWDETLGKQLDVGTRFNEIVFVECEFENQTDLPVLAKITLVDHHSPWHRGYGKPPSEYWSASSIGQICEILNCKPGKELRMIAAADHCLGAAYRGKCHGVDPDELMEWRAKSRAEFQRRPVDAIMEDVRSAMEKISAAPVVYLYPATGSGRDDRYEVADLRGPAIPELPEAAARLGRAVMAGPLRCPDGRLKIVLQSAGEDAIEEWLAGGGPKDVVDRYGDPQRGFAGGYLK